MASKQQSTFRAQAKALLRRNASLQRRSPCANLFIVLTPILLIVLLLVLQILVDIAITTDDTKCGCLCLTCCDTVDDVETCRDATADNPCISGKYDSCKLYDETQCGIQYSNSRQITWCAIESPSIWPPVAQVPSVGYLAEPESPKAALLITGDSEQIVNEVDLFPVPNITESEALRAQAFAERGNQTGAQYVGSSFLGVTIGTFQKYPNYNYYLEPAFRPYGDYNGSLSVLTRDSESPGSNAAVGIVNAIAGNLEVPLTASALDADQVFVESADDINSILYCGYKDARCNNGSTEINEYTNAWDFSATDFVAGKYNMRFWYNATGRYPANGQAPTMIVRVQAAINSATNAFLRRSVASTSIARFVGTMAMPKPSSKLELDIASLIGVLFYTWMLQLLLPVMLSTLVSEKENRLRSMMKMHGLGDGVYWLVQYVWYFTMNLVYVWILIGMGSAIDLSFFTETDYSFQFVFYLLWTGCLVATTFLLSACFASSRTSTVTGFLYVFATGLIGYLLLAKLVSAGYWWVIFIELIPGFALYRGLYEIANYAFVAAYGTGTGITWSNLDDPGNGLVGVMIIFAVESVVFLVIAWYLEQIYPQGCGVPRHPLFFIGKKYKSELYVADEEDDLAESQAHQSETGTSDVLREKHRVHKILADGMPGQTDVDLQHPIVVSKLKKAFRGKGVRKYAVKDLTIAIENGECFGLLGPNGAGKSTSLNMLTGFLTPNGGSALVDGNDISTDMDKVYKVMGVCPQDNLLWEKLTARDHLLFYARLKMLQGEQLDRAVEDALRSVNLLNGGVADKQVKKFSGGMKRRLSVAISFIGTPRVVYLDEPSTGLDPASRQNLWDVVKKGKDGRGIILTTHSMEEASVLCDRLGIFVDGELVCIGSPNELTSRYGGFFVFTITVKDGFEHKVAPFVRSICPSARQTYSVATTRKYELPTSDVTLDAVFDVMREKEQELGVIDFSVSNASLEEVFIKFCKEHEVVSGE